MRNAVAWLVLATICGFGFWKWQAEQHPAPSQRPAAAAPAQLDDIVASYRSNEIAADLAWKGKRVATSGRAIEFGKSALDEPFINFRSGRTDVCCRFGDEDLASLARMKPGDVVAFTGEVAGLTLGVLIIRDCRLSRPVPAR